MARRTEKQHSTQKTPIQSWETNTRTSPVDHERTIRRQTVSVVTTSFGGKLVPLKAIGLHREDRVRDHTLTLNVQMAETASMLLNPVRIACAAYLVPKLALDRFNDMGTIDRSYNGQQEIDGSVVPWFETRVWDGTWETHEKMGLHGQAGSQVNTDYLEAYNAIWNHIAVNRSPSIAPRGRLSASLGPAFWANTQMKHVVPTFDDAMMEGVVPIVFQDARLPVRAGSTQPNGVGELRFGSSADGRQAYGNEANQDGLLAAEFENVTSNLSLASIDLARETAAWARLRTQYQGKSEEWMMDQLLAGIRIPDEGLRQPILIDTMETVIGMSQRYATDSANLTKSVVDGRTSMQLRIRTPQISCGGVVMIVAQALPEQIYERQIDYYMAATTVEDLPNRTQDELDPQPVEMVSNKEVDVAHSVPEGLFGYAPLNHRWTGGGPNVGGRYYKPNPAAPWDEDRNRIWDTGVVDPALGPDFYMSTSLQHEVFETSTEEPFEWWLGGETPIEGLTYFGPQIRESTDDYESVLGQIDQTRLKGDGTDDPAVTTP